LFLWILNHLIIQNISNSKCSLFFFQILHLIISYCRILGEMKILFKKIKRLLTCILVSATHTFKHFELLIFWIIKWFRIHKNKMLRLKKIFFLIFFYIYSQYFIAIHYVASIYILIRFTRRHISIKINHFQMDWQECFYENKT
jgi:hypothetical protein